MSFAFYLRAFLKANDVKIDLVLASSRSFSTLVGLLTNKVGDYDFYLHEPLRALCSSVAIRELSTQHEEEALIQAFDDLLKKRKPGKKKSILIKEMVIDLENKDLHWRLLIPLIEHSTKVLMFARNPIERFDSLGQLFGGQQTELILWLINQENVILAFFKKKYGFQVFNTSRSKSELHSNLLEFLNSITIYFGRQSTRQVSIQHVTIDPLTYELIALDHWARKSFHLGKNSVKGLGPSETVQTQSVPGLNQATVFFENHIC